MTKRSKPKWERKPCGCVKTTLSIGRVGSFPAQRWVERHLHAQFARDRLDGEWFAPNERVQGALELVRILWGEPADSEAA